MPLAARSLDANIEQSLNAYIEAQLIVAAGLVVRLPGMPGMNNPPARWIEVDYTGLGPFDAFASRTIDGIGHRSQLSVDLAHFEQMDARWDSSGNATAYTLSAMMDITREAFALDAVIPINDYTAGGMQVGVFTVLSMPLPVSVVTPAELRLDQRVLSAPLLYDEVVLNP